ncbi:hypothetical protein EW146_g4868 [Bondarzewia mesenterica]|uniref:Inosine/uridine-preferring nucleoside hydrolase domain-containing protein n=1 Tax=Bondarzewia mesenterica TaxID=1095465 RepID=A0A4S4LT92_9AGAM|nr:hypothetical protein EW146_g4868 [Bondarzewia mesenterica]
MFAELVLAVRTFSGATISSGFEIDAVPFAGAYWDVSTRIYVTLICPTYILQQPSDDWFRLCPQTAYLQFQRKLLLFIAGEYLDTDPGVDDTIAILLALASPEIEIVGYVVSFGNTDLPAAYANIFKMYQAVSRHKKRHPESFPNFDQARKPFLAKGALGPLSGELHSAHDGLGDLTQKHPDLNVPRSVLESPSHPQLQLTDRPGHEVALEALQKYDPREITYVILGPMTNLAQMVRADVHCVRERIGRVVIMGGALDVPGNTSPSAEFNFFADPYAVAELLAPPPAPGTSTPHPGIPLSRVLLLPLDITTVHELPFPLYASRVDPTFDPARPSVAEGKEPIKHFTSAFLQRTREIMRGFGKDAMELHDVAAMWCAILNPPVKDASDETDDLGLAPGWTVERRKFAMERTGEVTRGMCVVDRRDDKGAYAPGANRAAVQAALERQQLKHGPFESIALPAQVVVEEQSQTKQTKGEGVPTIKATPGSDVLVDMILKRLWNPALLAALACRSCPFSTTCLAVEQTDITSPVHTSLSVQLLSRNFSVHSFLNYSALD